MASTTTSTVVRAFAARFAGLARSHGRYLVPTGTAPDARGKVDGKAWTSRKKLTEADWAAHLSGAPVTVAHGDGRLTGVLGLGQVPIRDDGACAFGAIDVDVYPLDLIALNEKVQRLHLPLVVFRSKSGGAHLYLFASEPVPATLVRDRLTRWAAALGHAGVEVFPKQTRLVTEDDEGNWINLPYAGGDRSSRYALDPADSHALTVEEFLSLADEVAVTATRLQDFEISHLNGAVVHATVDGHVDDRLIGAPPCLVTLVMRGPIEHHRNDALFDFAVYYRKRHGGGQVEALLHLANADYAGPPLAGADVTATARSVAKKDYNYKCRHAPIAAVCDRRTCLTREFGVTGGAHTPEETGVVMGELVKLQTDPVTWLWEIDGAQLEFTTTEIMDQMAFHAKVIEVLSRWPHAMKPAAWKTLVSERLSRCDHIAVPLDATRRGQLWVNLQRFCTSRVVGKSLDELLMGKPYTDEQNNKTFFCSSDFLQYLQQHRFGALGERELYGWLRELDVEHHYGPIKGKDINYWSVPAFATQTEPHAVPRADLGEKM